MLFVSKGHEGRGICKGCAQNIVDCIRLLRRVHNGGRGDAQPERHCSAPCEYLAIATKSLTGRNSAVDLMKCMMNGSLIGQYRRGEIEKTERWDADGGIKRG